MSTQARYGVLLVGHGTRDRRGTEEFFQLGDRLSKRLELDALVVPCLLEFQEPTIAQAWQSVVEAGCQRVVVAPLLLFAAGHAKSDIPEEIAAAQKCAPGSDSIELSFCPPISRQTAMVDAIRERLGQAARMHTCDRRRTAIVMVGRGSRDVCASADMRVLSEVAVKGAVNESGESIASQLGIAPEGLFTTFYAMAEPRLPDTLQQVAASNQYDCVIVHPHLLFSGRLYDAIQRQVDEAATQHPEIEFCVSDYLGPSEQVAQSVAARIRSTVASVIEA